MVELKINDRRDSRVFARGLAQFRLVNFAKPIFLASFQILLDAKLVGRQILHMLVQSFGEGIVVVTTRVVEEGVHVLQFEIFSPASNGINGEGGHVTLGKLPQLLGRRVSRTPLRTTTGPGLPSPI